MLPIPSVADVAGFSGRPEPSYTGYVQSASLQAALLLTILGELDVADFDGFADSDQRLVLMGINAMADYIYLRGPYQQLIASPLQTETIGSYSYSKAEQQTARNAAAVELGAEKTGVMWFDLALQMLAKRTRAGGVFSGGITVFEDGSEVDQAELLIRVCDGRMVVVGPQERNQLNLPFDINAPQFPMDPSGF